MSTKQLLNLFIVVQSCSQYQQWKNKAKAGKWNKTYTLLKKTNIHIL